MYNFSMFIQKKLPYDFKDLNPVISEESLKTHYNKHHVAYTTNFNNAISDNNIKTDFSEKSLLNIFSKISNFPKSIENHGGGYWNHTFFWDSLKKPTENNIPKNEIMDLINDTFKNFENFKLEFSNSAKSLFGSGWTWLVLDNTTKKLKIIQTANQQNPLMDIVKNKEGNVTPLLVIDVWEHAYYIDYKNRRPDFIENFFKIINWDIVNQRINSK